VLLMALLVMLGWAALGGTGHTAHADPAAGTLNILYPAPSAAGQSSGPVGANVTISASGLSTSDSYTLGFATKDTGCAAGYTPITQTPIKAAADGTYTGTFVWSQDAPANQVGTNYVLCLRDQTTTTVPDVASQQAYVVLSAKAPSIALTRVPSAAATPGQPTPPPPGDSKYYAGDQIRITGSNFVPAQDLGAFLGAAASAPPGSRPDLGVGLNLASGSLKSADDGSFRAVVQLPDATQLQPGTYQLCVVSGDGSSNGPPAPPSLEVCKSLTIQAAPTPTPTATATVKPTATGSLSDGGHNNTGGIPGLRWIVGFGGLSVLLFFAGVILLASAAAMPRPDRPQ
jgi:hypothetical protein